MSAHIDWKRQTSCRDQAGSIAVNQDIQDQILTTIDKKESVTAPALGQITGWSRQTCLKRLRKLEDQGLLESFTSNYTTAIGLTISFTRAKAPRPPVEKPGKGAKSNLTSHLANLWAPRN